MPWWICPFAGCFPLLFFKFIKLKQRSQQIAFLRGSKPFQNQYQKQDMLMLCKHCMLNVHRFVTFRKPLLHISLQFTQFYQSCFLLHCHATCTFAFLDAFVIPASDAGVCVCSFPAKNASKYFEAKVWHLRAPFPPLRLFSVLVHLLSIQKGTNWSIDARCVWPPPPECHPLQNKIQTLPDKCATSSHVNTAANDFALVLYSFCFPSWGGGASYLIMWTCKFPQWTVHKLRRISSFFLFAPQPPFLKSTPRIFLWAKDNQPHKSTITADFNTHSPLVGNIQNRDPCVHPYFSMGPDAEKYPRLAQANLILSVQKDATKRLRMDFTDKKFFDSTPQNPFHVTMEKLIWPIDPVGHSSIVNNKRDLKNSDAKWMQKLGTRIPGCMYVCRFESDPTRNCARFILINEIGQKHETKYNDALSLITFTFCRQKSTSVFRYHS